MSAPPDDFLAFMEVRRREYGAELPGKLAALEAHWRDARTADDGSGLAELERAAHSLAGSAGTLGFAAVGEVSKVLELAVARLAEGESKALAAARAEVEAALASVRLAIGAVPR